jgi:RNA polymerase-binding transcription factor DksA
MMGKMEREEARELLEAERGRLEAIASEERARLVGPADDIRDEEEALAILHLAEDRSAEVQLALEKVAADRFGRCETCDTAIDEERLLARPDARFCEVHERDWELRHLLLRVPSMRRQGSEPREPGWRELQLVPDEDELWPPLELSAEERALHVVATGERLAPDEIEAAEAVVDEIEF